MKPVRHVPDITRTPDRQTTSREEATVTELSLDDLELVVGGINLGGGREHPLGPRRPWNSDMPPGTMQQSFNLGSEPSHLYHVRTPIPADISPAAAQYGLLFSAPTRSGEPITIGGRSELVGFLGSNPVRHPDTGDPNVQMNITEPGHFLHVGGGPMNRGQVINSIAEIDGQRYYDSLGTAHAPPADGMLGSIYSNYQQFFNGATGGIVFQNQQERMLNAALQYSRWEGMANTSEMMNNVQQNHRDYDPTASGAPSWENPQTIGSPHGIASPDQPFDGGSAFANYSAFTYQHDPTTTDTPNMTFDSRWAAVPTATGGADTAFTGSAPAYQNSSNYYSAGETGTPSTTPLETRAPSYDTSSPANAAQTYDHGNVNFPEPPAPTPSYEAPADQSYETQQQAVDGGYSD
jgi:hypothetical protein